MAWFGNKTEIKDPPKDDQPVIKRKRGRPVGTTKPKTVKPTPPPPTFDPNIMPKNRPMFDKNKTRKFEKADYEYAYDAVLNGGTKIVDLADYFNCTKETLYKDDEMMKYVRRAKAEWKMWIRRSARMRVKESDNKTFMEYFKMTIGRESDEIEGDGSSDRPAVMDFGLRPEDDNG